MQKFNSSTDKDYILRIQDILELDNLLSEAIDISATRKKGKGFTQFIRIDFLGVAATTLFDVGEVFPSANVYSQVEKILLRAKEFNERGIFVKIRILLEYPFSTSSYARIIAESSSQRASMEDARYTIDLKRNVEKFDVEDYYSSFLIHTQKSILNNIQFLEDELRRKGNWNSPENPNSITVRFTAINPGVCVLFINNHLFYDALLFSKAKRQHMKFTNCCPIIEINSDEDEMAFKSFEDHFRYLWNHRTTLDCDDATDYDPNIPKSLSKVKEPSLINYKNKIHRLSHSNNRNNSVYGNWESATFYELNKHCSNLSPSPAFDSLFITCSWTKADDDVFTPNEYATLLSEFFNVDFSKAKPHYLEVYIMQAATSEFLSKQLYRALDKSTIGLILMTRDIKDENGKFYCKPNVYHELGYLMKQLGKDRIIIFREKDVYVPSNIQDVIRIEFDKHRMSLRYIDLVKKLYEITKLENKVFINSMNNHLERLRGFLEEKEISVDEFNKARDRIVAWQSSLNK